MTVVRYCTPEWLELNGKAYQDSPRFSKEFAKLSMGVCYQVRAEPAWGIDRDIFFIAQVDKGDLIRLGFLSQADAFAQADFILAAPPQEWKRILRKESKFVADFMTGKIILEKGSKVAVLSLAPYSNTFIDALTQYDLQFPDEMNPQELEQYCTDVQAFRAALNV